MKGQSRCFINDTPVPLAVLKEIGDHLVDLHGQHEHQSLLRTETHGALLDEFGGLEGLVREYRSHYENLTELFSKMRALLQKEHELKEKRGLYDFQIKEIDDVDPHAGEEAELENELAHFRKLRKTF